MGLPTRPQPGLPSQPPAGGTPGTPGTPITPMPPTTPTYTPAAPLTQPAPATGSAVYRAVGNLTAEQLLHGRPDEFDHLQDRIIQAREWLQTHLTGQGRAEAIAEARRDPAQREAMTEELDRYLIQYLNKESVARGSDRNVIVACVINEVLGLGPIEPLWSDHRITEVMVNGPDTVFVEIEGQIVRAPGARFRDREHLLEVCQQILVPLNRRVDQRAALADGRLSDGSRVNIVHHAVAPGGPLLTIRRFPDTVWTLKDLIENGSVTAEMGTELAWLVHYKACVLIVGGTGGGKALDVATPIATPDGFTTMGELKVGDTVFAEDGSPCSVTAVFDQPDGRECFAVEFSDGTEIVADADHNWFTYDRAARRAESRQRRAPARTWGPRPQVRTTRELLATLRTASGHANHSVEVITKPVAYPTREQPIDPYILGAWLGDGATSNGEITSADPEIIDAYRAAGYPVGGFITQLKALGVANNKHIPDNYLYADEQQRRDLLAGLLDTDGGTSGSGSGVCFHNTNERLIEQVRTLAASLGYQTTVSKNAAMLNGIDHGVVYTVEFNAYADVFRLSRKNAEHRALRASTPTPRSTHRYITNIRPVPSRRVRCITVDSPSHLFLAGEHYIPTHNTSLLNALSSCIPRDERVITVEDSLELRLHPDAHVAAMEARPAAASGDGEVRIRDLVKNALRMRPDRIVVGEVRDASALDMLQAMNTGHEGSMTTVHANGPDEAINRLGVLVAQGGDIPENKVQWLIGDAVDIMVIQRRYEDGSRRVQGIYEVPSMKSSPDGSLTPIPLWVWTQTGVSPDGKFVGEYVKHNEISDDLMNTRRLHQHPRFTVEDVYRMSELPAGLRRKAIR